MINPDAFCLALKKAGYSFVTGVPDSLLKELSKNFIKKFKKNHIISTNEGSAVGFAIGYYLGNKKPAVVYLQNSGLGNIINPITSLANPKVYGIPMLLIVGWRGEIKNKIQINDEPQHKFQGEITLKQLKLLNIPHKIIDSKTKNFAQVIKNLKKKSIKSNTPVAVVVRKNTFLKSIYNFSDKKKYNFVREDIIKDIINVTKDKNVVIVSTTGMASRELYELRKKNNQNHFKDFFTIGGMGHASQIAAGLAFNSKKKIICIDGDGSMLMHTGSMGISAQINNFLHIIINNSSHDSVGGQPTLGKTLNLKEIGKNFGYKTSYSISKKKQFKKVLYKCIKTKKSSIIVINCDKGYRKDLGRPEKNMKKRKDIFLEYKN
ncbi:phosphonopyruvate decarboxylase [Candidatus Pelagibacter sp.]|nr:phosphonopyruvate decarboxylase [Candidatus Pelagibacter sp.]